MPVSYRKATLASAKPLIGLYAESGKGKTYSALLLARGFAGPSAPIAMIETESGRGEAYADMIPGGYDVIPLSGDFAPKLYGEAIKAAEAQKVGALIIDSASHEWDGAGGVLSMAAENQASGKKGVIVWQKPKMEHQRHFMLPLMGTSIPLVIVNMRAKYPMREVVKPGTNVKEWVRSDALEPKQADDILFEMMIHGWIDDEHRFRGTKYTRPDLADVVRDREPISVATGERLAAWSRGVAATFAPTAPPELSEMDKAHLLALESVAEANGLNALQSAWEALKPETRKALLPHKARLGEIARRAEARFAETTP